MSSVRRANIVTSIYMSDNLQYVVIDYLNKVYGQVCFIVKQATVTLA